MSTFREDGTALHMRIKIWSKWALLANSPQRHQNRTLTASHAAMKLSQTCPNLYVSPRPAPLPASSGDYCWSNSPAELFLSIYAKFVAFMSHLEVPYRLITLQVITITSDKGKKQEVWKKRVIMDIIKAEIF